MNDIIAKQKISRRKSRRGHIASSHSRILSIAEEFSKFQRKIWKIGKNSLILKSHRHNSSEANKSAGLHIGAQLDADLLAARSASAPKRPSQQRPSTLPEPIARFFLVVLRSAKNRFSDSRLIAPAALTVFLLTGMAAFFWSGAMFPAIPDNIVTAGEEIENHLLDFITSDSTQTNPGDADNLAFALPKTVSMRSYTVASGDTLEKLATRFGLRVDTIISANGITNFKKVVRGMELKIPNQDGIVHQVSGGENLGSIANRYKVDIALLADSNNLASSIIKPKDVIFIPHARLPSSTLKKVLMAWISWPVLGRISSGFGFRQDPFTGIRRYHNGVDIVANIGSSVKAAIDGTVSDVGYNVNYGNYIILTHADGYQTLYGHLTAATVKEGSKVSQGAVIGRSGNTGYSTGPHLHFSLFRWGAAQNPLKVLQ